MGAAEPSDWSALTDAYGHAFDPRDLLARFASGNDDAACWDEVWDRLHHQGEVGTASYAVVPDLVETFLSRERPWQLYAYVATLEECRRDETQPRASAWLEARYSPAMDILMDLAMQDARGGRGAGFLVSLYAFMAAKVGALGLSVALLNLGDNESAVEDLATFGDSLHDL